MNVSDRPRRRSNDATLEYVAFACLSLGQAEKEEFIIRGWSKCPCQPALMSFLWLWGGCMNSCMHTLPVARLEGDGLHHPEKQPCLIILPLPLLVLGAEVCPIPPHRLHTIGGSHKNPIKLS